MEEWKAYSTDKLAAEQTLSQMDLQELREELRRTRELCKFFEAALKDAADGFAILDGAGVILWANKAWLSLLGIDTTVLGTNVLELVGEVISESCAAKVIETNEMVTMEQTLTRTGRTIFVTGKPLFDEDGAISVIISNNRDFSELAALRNQLAETERRMMVYCSQIEALHSTAFFESHIVAQDKRMLDTIYRANKVAHVDTSVLILGETGTGKEEIAKLIHRSSGRKEGPFVTINCGAISEALIESEMFGYEKGAFTGASTTGKVGLFEVADGGVLFLDEVGELPLAFQVKLLRVLQEQTFRRVGGTKPIKTDVRILAATNRNLYQMVQEGTFREDLYYRLNVVSIEIPPLRERKDDIIPLAQAFLKEFREKYNMQVTFQQNAYKALRGYAWPGNVRELRNAVEQALVMCESTEVSAADLPFVPADAPAEHTPQSDLSMDEALALVERRYILEAYQTFGSVRKAAASLNMSATTYARKLKIYRAHTDWTKNGTVYQM